MTTCRIKSEFHRNEAGHQWCVIVAFLCQIHLFVFLGKILYNAIYRLRGYIHCFVFTGAMSAVIGI